MRILPIALATLLRFLLADEEVKGAPDCCQVFADPCPQDAIIQKAVRLTKQVESSLQSLSTCVYVPVGDTCLSIRQAILDLAVDPGIGSTTSSICPSGACCVEEGTLNDFIIEFYNHESLFINQKPSTCVSLLPNGDAIVTAMLIRTSVPDPEDRRVYQVDFYWQPLYGCGQFQLARINMTSTDCLGQTGLLTCYECGIVS